MAVPRGFRFTSPLERSELPFLAVSGEVKYKISVFGPEAKMIPITIGRRNTPMACFGDNRFQEIFIKIYNSNQRYNKSVICYLHHQKKLQ